LPNRGPDPAGQKKKRRRKGVAGMGRILMAILVLAVIGFIGLAGYAYLGDMTPPQAPVTHPVTLNVD
jgi:hypothetical protein